MSRPMALALLHCLRPANPHLHTNLLVPFSTLLSSPLAPVSKGPLLCLGSAISCCVSSVYLIIISRMPSPTLFWVRVGPNGHAHKVRAAEAKQWPSPKCWIKQAWQQTELPGEAQLVLVLCLCPVHLPDAQPCWPRTRLDVQSGGDTETASPRSLLELLHHNHSSVIGCACLFRLTG